MSPAFGVGGFDVDGRGGIGFPFFWARRAFFDGGVGAETSISSSFGVEGLGTVSFVLCFFFLDGSSFVDSLLRFMGFSGVLGDSAVIESCCAFRLCFFSFLTEDLSFEESFLLLAGLMSSISSKDSGKSASKIWEENFGNSAINLRESLLKPAANGVAL